LGYSRGQKRSTRSIVDLDTIASGTTDVRFLALPIRSQGEPRRGAQGRFDPFAKPTVNDRYLRTADIADALTAKRSFALSHAGVEVVVLKPVGRRGSPFTKER
jgi:hypothetical protein